MAIIHERGPGGGDPPFVPEELFRTRLNAESYPRSANAFDSLGEAYLSPGKLEAARESYGKALALTPDSENARKMIGVIDARIAGEAPSKK
jgi:tetratricopeptide (TPR) repeat protein